MTTNTATLSSSTGAFLETKFQCIWEKSNSTGAFLETKFQCTWEKSSSTGAFLETKFQSTWQKSSSTWAFWETKFQCTWEESSSTGALFGDKVPVYLRGVQFHRSIFGDSSSSATERSPVPQEHLWRQQFQCPWEESSSTGASLETAVPVHLRGVQFHRSNFGDSTSSDNLTALLAYRA